MKTTVKDIRDMFSEFDENTEVIFEIDEDTCEELKDDYRYSPELGYPYKARDGKLVCKIDYFYNR